MRRELHKNLSASAILRKGRLFSMRNQIDRDMNYIVWRFGFLTACRRLQVQLVVAVLDQAHAPHDLIDDQHQDRRKEAQHKIMLEGLAEDEYNKRVRK